MDDSHHDLDAITQDPKQAIAELLAGQLGVCQAGACQLADYFLATYKALGVIPSQKKIVLERFFDESGGMQLVLHSPFGIRLNRKTNRGGGTGVRRAAYASSEELTQRARDRGQFAAAARDI